MISDKLKDLFDDDDQGLLNVPKKSTPVSSSDRLEASFLEIVDFYTENRRAPTTHTSDIYERKLGARLNGLISDENKVSALKHLDTYNLLQLEEPPKSIDTLLANDNLGLLNDETGILNIKNVPKQINTADYKAQQRPCRDFYKFEPLFMQVHEQLKSGEKKLKKFMTEQQVAEGEFFVLRGQVVYVAERGQDFMSEHGKRDARLRVIYENGTESDLLSRTLARGLYRGGSRIVGDIDALEDERDSVNENDKESGHIYILKSESDDPLIANIDNLYKVGYSSNGVDERIRNAQNDPTYLMASVKVVASYKTYNLNPQKFEHLLHRLFADAKLDLSLIDKKSKNYNPVEWFVVPLEVIDQAIDLIINGQIVNYRYNDQAQSLVTIK